MKDNQIATCDPFNPVSSNLFDLSWFEFSQMHRVHRATAVNGHFPINGNLHYLILH
jgi:hypothetical protein